MVNDAPPTPPAPTSPPSWDLIRAELPEGWREEAKAHRILTMRRAPHGAKLTSVDQVLHLILSYHDCGTALKDGQGQPFLREAMTIALTEETRGQLDTYLQGLGDLLGTSERRANFALYAVGLLSEGERKSVEPIAARAAGNDPELCQRYHDRLSHFLREAPWSDHDVRASAVERTLATLTQHESLDVWIVDDTGFLKQGTASPGVQRQYTGSAGKIANCQIAVSLTVATRTAHVLADMAVYLPESWAYDTGTRSVNCGLNRCSS